jgi:hypothetical protein
MNARHVDDLIPSIDRAEALSTLAKLEDEIKRKVEQLREAQRWAEFNFNREMAR